MVYERTPYFLYIYTFLLFSLHTPTTLAFLPAYLLLTITIMIIGRYHHIHLVFFFTFFSSFPFIYQYLRDFYLLFSFLLLFFCCCCCVHSHNNLSDSVVTRKHSIKRMKREEERKMISLHVFRDVSPWSSLHFLIYSVSSSSWAKMMMTVL